MFSESEISMLNDKFAEFDSDVLLNTSVNHLALHNQNSTFTNYLFPHLLNKIKILDLSKGAIESENNQFNFVKLEELILKNFKDLFSFTQSFSTLKRLTITEKMAIEE